MSAELCRVGLWLEALEPGKPLSFLDHHIQCGNSLLGTTPALLAKGIPDAAFTAIEGDDKSVCTEFKKKNLEFITYSKEELAEFQKIAAKPVWDEWVAEKSKQGVPAQELLDLILDTAKAAAPKS